MLYICLGRALFNDLNDKNVPVTHLAPSTDEKIAERISASTSSYTAESNEDTFKSDTVFESFHHQAKILISDRALLAGFYLDTYIAYLLLYSYSHSVINPAIILS